MAIQDLVTTQTSVERSDTGPEQDGRFRGAERRQLPQFGIAHYFLGQVYEQQQQLDEAVAAFAKARDLTGNSAETVAALAHAHARQGDRAMAEELLSGLITPPAGGYVSPTRIALVHAGLGDTDAALASLEEALRLRAIDLVWLQVWPWFASLRADARFARLVSALGLPQAPENDAA